MPRPTRQSEGDQGKRLQSNLPPGDNWAERFELLRRHLGLSESAAVATVVRDGILAFEHDDTKDRKLKDIQAELAHMKAKQDLVLYIVWALLTRNGSEEPIKVGKQQVVEIKQVLAELTI